MTRWAACTEHTQTRQAWLDWACGGDLAADAETPSCPVGAMLRRRLTPLGRLSLSALHGIDPAPGEPIIFASSWGDISRSFALVSALARNEPMSPMGFASSVHNGIGATASIWLANTHAYQAISAGAMTTEAALVEVYSQLYQGASSVVLVRYEDVMPALWNHGVTDCPDQMFAWAARFELGQGAAADQAVHFSLTREPPSQEPEPDQHSVLGDWRFLLGPIPSYRHSLHRESWLWEKTNAEN